MLEELRLTSVGGIAEATLNFGAGLIAVTGEPCPPQLATLKEKTPRFTDCCNREDMAKQVYQMLGIEA